MTITIKITLNPVKNDISEAITDFHARAVINIATFLYIGTNTSGRLYPLTDYLLI